MKGDYLHVDDVQEAEIGSSLIQGPLRVASIYKTVGVWTVADSFSVGQDGSFVIQTEIDHERLGEHDVESRASRYVDVVM